MKKTEHKANAHRADLDIIGLKAARPLRADLQPNLFSELRACQDPELVDTLELKEPPPADALLGEHEVVLFVPGCVLSAASAPLVAACYDWLLARHAVNGITLRCCGNILKSVATFEEREEYLRSLKASFAKYNVRKIITSCPNCFKAYNQIPGLEHLQIVPLSELFADAGVKIDTGAGTGFCVHDSCPDRPFGRFASSVRALFDKNSLHEMKHNRSQSICCGLGKMMAMTHPSKSVEINARRQNEFTAAGAQTLVTYCATCTQAFQPQFGAVDVEDVGLHKRYAYHYLELIFGIAIDWEWFLAAYEEIFYELQELADEPQG